MDTAMPLAEAFIVDRDRILAVGAAAELEHVLAAGDRRVDLLGRTVIPGLIDAHVHFSWFAYNLIDVDLDGAASLEEALDLVRDRVARTPGGGWVRGHGFNANLWERWPTARDLDRVAPCHPVMLSSKDAHSVWVNSMVMRLAGVTAATATPAGGNIMRDQSGEPTGVFQENANRLVTAVAPRRTQAELQDALRLGLRYANQMGVTSVHDMDGVDCFRGLQALHARGELTVRFFKQVNEGDLDAALAAGLTTGFGDEWLRIGCAKLFADGSLGSQTAHMLDSFEERPGYLGVPTHTPESLRELVTRAVQGDMAVAVHAIGDAANRMVLDVLEDLAPLSRARGLRHRIEHAQLLTEEDIPRFAELGVIASVQPSHAPSDRYIADQFWGTRSRYAYAFRSLLRAGARLAFGSDVPVEPLDPLAGLHAAIWRKRLTEPESESWYPEERLSLAEALYGFTVGAAYASGEEHLKGSISIGKLADFVVLDRDLGNGEEEVLRNIKPEATVVGGRVVFGEV